MAELLPRSAAARVIPELVDISESCSLSELGEEAAWDLELEAAGFLPKCTACMKSAIEGALLLVPTRLLLLLLLWTVSDALKTGTASFALLEEEDRRRGRTLFRLPPAEANTGLKRGEVSGLWFEG
jgi:hypothetical protein